MKRIELFTDGSAKGNPGPGGFGAILRFGNNEKELSQGFRLTTNNRMELLAVISGLEALKSNEYKVIVYSDSKYVVDAVKQGWVFNWEKKGFKGKKNSDLWTRYLGLHQRFTPEFVWVKGHAGHPENERCDQLAVKAAEDVNNHLIDTFFEENKDAWVLTWFADVLRLTVYTDFKKSINDRMRYFSSGRDLWAKTGRNEERMIL